MDAPASSKGAPQRLSERSFYALALLLVFLAYFIVLSVTNGAGLLRLLLYSVRNLVPLALLAAAVQPLIKRFVMGRRVAVQLSAHLLLSSAFALLWYWLMMVMIGLTEGDSPTRFSVKPFFPTPAVAWQLLQGVSFYTAFAAVTYLRAQPPKPNFVVADLPPQSGNSKEAGLSRYFIRQGDDIYPVDISQIVSITGADDYAEVATLGGRHLVRMTLAEFEAALEEGKFIRVHRSRIVNVDRIQRAEPAGGGRMLLHMDNGEMIQASRAGARLLRDRVI